MFSLLNYPLASNLCKYSRLLQLLKICRNQKPHIFAQWSKQKQSNAHTPRIHLQINAFVHKIQKLYGTKTKILQTTVSHQSPNVTMCKALWHHVAVEGARFSHPKIVHIHRERHLTVITPYKKVFFFFISTHTK